MFESNFVFKGKHATMVKFLSRKFREESPKADLWKRNIDVYMNAVVWGLLEKRKAEEDTTAEEETSIFAEKFLDERANCEFLYRMVMLLDNTLEERRNRAFGDDSDPSKEKENMELFHSYVRGGVEVMYEKFTKECDTPDDYLSKTYEIMKDFEETFKKEIKEIEEISKGMN